MKGKAIFFGDSITAGEKTDKCFVDILNFNTSYNEGVSGTTVGEYSIYPVDSNSLVSKIHSNEDKIKECDYIFIEYGINDASSLAVGYADIKRMQVDVVKAFDHIKQLNDKAKIYFLTLSSQSDIVEKYAKNHVRYLNEDYLSGMDKVSVMTWIKAYFNVLAAVGKKCDIIDMINDKAFLENYMDEDTIHPNTEGQKIIAERIKERVEK